jgi:methionine-rich copper-binding protein CopC
VLGQIFTVNGYRSDSLSVPAAYGKMRLWRNTPLASLAANSSYTFQPGTLGYEWDSVEDNGFQPPGVAQLSRTSVTMSGNYVLQNYGDLYGPGTKTHALTLYKYQPSGALVFAAGTVQWAWGVEDEHLFQTATPTSDVRMKQATVNLLADMGVQPVTLQTGLVQAMSSTNMVPPTVTMDATQSPIVGTAYTFSGTVNSAAGQVAGVEVSVDGGSTWHPANWQASGTTWNYTFTPRSSGARTLEVRATDDSANLSQPVTRSVTVNPRTCPCGIWNETTVPTNPSINDSSALELGVKFQASASGYIQAVKFYKGTGNTGTHTGSLWSASGQLIATGTFTGETATGWQSMTFPSGVAITANTTYITSYHTDTGHYAGDTNYFTNSSDGLEPLTALQGTSTSPNGVYKLGASGFPTSSYQNTNYWVDVRFGYDPGPGLPPQVVSTNPVNGQTSVSLVAAPSVTFTKPLSQSSLKFTLSGPAGNVPGTAALSTDGTVATFTPSQSLTAGTQYTASISAYDQSGNALPNAPYTWSFTTGNPRPANCPCTVWDDFASPTVATVNDPAAIEVGTKMRFDNSGQVVGVRFYKGVGNTGTHVGSLWSSTGTRLASGTFTGESASGWQSLTFSTPVSVQANTTYLVSYYAPNGGYSATNGYFANGGADFGTLHALPNGLDGPNGIYRYGASGFPTSSYNSTNYWVDVMWQPDATSTPPSVVSTSPVSGATNVALNAPVSATFNKPVNLSSAQFSLADPGGAKLNGTLSLSSDGKTVTWTAAAPLAAGTTYTASIRIADTNGNLMPTPTTWSFTATTTQTCPCSLFSAATVPTVTSSTDAASYELGVRFTTSVNGSITGVKFYKGSGNTGTHTGSLWTVNGQLLATGTFSGETATGWQTLTFATPVAVQAGVTYVASYTTTVGHYAADAGYFQRTAVTSPPLSAPATATGAPNGVYATGSGFPTATYQGGNYWVDVVFK